MRLLHFVFTGTTEVLPLTLSPRLRRASLLGAAALALGLTASSTATAATLATSYDLAGDLTASYALAPDWDDVGPELELGTVGGAPAFVDDAGIAAPRKAVADLAAGEGLTVPAHGLATGERYAIGVSFRLTDADPDDVASDDTVPVLSFDAGASGTGLAVRDGVLGWWHAPTSGFTALGPVADGAWQSVVVSRALSGAVRLDRAGASASVAAGVAAPSVFGDDVRLLGPGAGAAQVARVRTWDGALSTEELDAVTAPAAVADAVAPARVELDDTWAVEDGGELWMAAPEIAGEADDDGTGPLAIAWSVRAGTCAGGGVLASGSDGYAGTFPGADALSASTWFEEYPDVAGLQDGGAYALCATATDRRGNTATDVQPIRIDATAPAPTLDLPSAAGTPVLGGTAGTARRDSDHVWVTLWRGTSTPGWDEDPFERFAGAGIGTVAGGRWTATLLDFDDRPLGALPDGDYVAEATQCDLVGNCGTVTQAFRVSTRVTVVDPPIYTVVQRPPGQTGLPPRPGLPAVAAPAEAFLTSAVAVLERGGVKGLLRTSSLTAGATAPGRLQVVVFAGAAPKKVVAYASAAKKAKAATLPANAIASGTATVKHAGTATVKVKPTKRAKRLVGRKRSVRVTVRSIFTPAGGGRPVAQDRKLTLKR